MEKTSDDGAHLPTAAYQLQQRKALTIIIYNGASDEMNDPSLAAFTCSPFLPFFETRRDAHHQWSLGTLSLLFTTSHGIGVAGEVSSRTN